MQRDTPKQVLGRAEIGIFAGAGSTVGAIAGSSMLVTSEPSLVFYGIVFGIVVGAVLGLLTAVGGMVLERVKVPPFWGVMLTAAVVCAIAALAYLRDIEAGLIATAALATVGAGLLALALQYEQRRHL